MPMIFVILIFAGGTVAVDNNLAAEQSDIALCYDEQGQLKAGEGTDYIDCDNLE